MSALPKYTQEQIDNIENLSYGLEGLRRHVKFMKSPCHCNGERKKCTAECSHPPYFRKECTPTCGESCVYRKLPKDWKPLKLHVRKDDRDRYALDGGVLIADEDAPPGRILIAYSGHVVFKGKYEMDWRKEGYGRKLFMEYYDEFIINGKRYGNEARFARHSCTPNCDAELWYERDEDMVSPRVMLVANQEIKKGDEITYTYNVNNVDYLPKMVCSCGKPTCPDFHEKKSPKKPKQSVAD